MAAEWIATEIQWSRFSGEWPKILRAAGFEPPVFHATDFEKWAHDNPAKAIRVRQRLLTQIHKRTRGHAIAAVSVEPYEEARRERLTPPLTPFGFAIMEVIKKVGAWADQHQRTQPISYFFEDQSQQRGEVIKSVDYIERTPSAQARFRYKTWGWVPKESPPAQAADMLAYEIWKECINGVLASPRQIPARRSLQAITHLVPNFSFYSENVWDAERERQRRGQFRSPAAC